MILREAFGINEGIAVDTHVKLVSYRLGLTKSKDPEKIEKDLMAVYPREEWGDVSNAFIALGRDACTALKKKCERCVLKDICPSSSVKAKQNAKKSSSDFGLADSSGNL